MKLTPTLLTRLILMVSLSAVPLLAAESRVPQRPVAPPCHWWQFHHCAVEGLPEDAPHEGTLVTIDVSTNTAYLFQDGHLISKSVAATGSGKVLKKGSRIWAFHTPRGHMKVLRKIPDPIWTKPDWAFVEAGQRVPPLNSPKRLVRGHLGKYALDLGDGIMIHGTDESDSLGRYVSHGCIRLPKTMLKTVYKSSRVGTDVYIFESHPRPEATVVTDADGQRVPEHHSDLDYRGTNN